MPWIIIIIVILLLVFSVQIYAFLFPIAFAIEQLLSILLRPVDALFGLVLKRDSRLPGARILRILILAVVTVASIAYIISAMSSGITLSDISDDMLGNSSIGQMLALFGESRFGGSIKEQFTYTALVSLGLSSFLSFLYMRCTVETIADFDPPQFIQLIFIIVFNLAFISISVLLSTQIGDFCVAAADKISAIRLTLTDWYHSGFNGFLNSVKVIFGGFFLFILYAAGIYLLVVTAREVVASLNYGFMSLLLTLVVGCFWTLLPEIFPSIPEGVVGFFGILLNITLPIAMFLPDYIRATDLVKNKLISYLKGE